MICGEDVGEPDREHIANKQTNKKTLQDTRMFWHEVRRRPVQHRQKPARDQSVAPRRGTRFSPAPDRVRRSEASNVPYF